MKIKNVETKQDLTEFIKFPWKIYKNDFYWVPPLYSEMRTLLGDKKNPFWKHAEKKLFLSVADNGETVGRIAGVIDNNFIEFHNEKTGFFAFFESINNQEVADNLVEAVRNFLKENNITKMIGPTAPSTNDEMGLLLEGYDSSPYLMMPYNFSYYHNLMEKSGLKKAKDLLAFSVKEKNLPQERLKRLVELVKKKEPNLVVRPVNLKNYSTEIKLIREVYNNAWEKNWGFVPWTEDEFHQQCERMKPLIVQECVLIAQIKERPVGILIGVPNYNEILKKLNGKFGPLQIIKFLWFRHKIHTMRIMIMGVVKEYRNRGIEAIMYKKIMENGLKLGFLEGEYSWILEDNTMMIRAAEMLGGKFYKKYRVYEGEL